MIEVMRKQACLSWHGSHLTCFWVLEKALAMVLPLRTVLVLHRHNHWSVMLPVAA